MDHAQEQRLSLPALPLAVCLRNQVLWGRGRIVSHAVDGEVARPGRFEACGQLRARGIRQCCHYGGIGPQGVSQRQLIERRRTLFATREQNQQPSAFPSHRVGLEQAGCQTRELALQHLRWKECRPSSGAFSAGDARDCWRESWAPMGPAFTVWCGVSAR